MELRAKVNSLLVEGIVGDCTNIPLHSESFDVILGSAIIHHLTPSQETVLYSEVHRLLKPGGFAIFMESLQNSTVLEFCRTAIPIRSRPSRFSRQWERYTANDPHPERPNTTKNYKAMFQKTRFSRFEFEELGVFSRLDRLSRKHNNFRRWIHDLDYRIKPFIPFAGKWCRNIVVKAWK